MVDVRLRGSDRVTGLARSSRWLPLPALGVLSMGLVQAGAVHSAPPGGPPAGPPASLAGAASAVAPDAASSAGRPAARPVAVLPVAVPMMQASSDPRPQAAGGSEIAGTVLADAYGANLEPLGTCLSCSTAQAGPNASAAEVRQIRVAGEPLSEGQVPSNGYSSGALLVLPQNPLLRLAIGDWDGWTAADRNGSQAHARGSLVRLAPADGGAATINAGESASDASYAGGASRGRSQSDGLRAELLNGRMVLLVLHSESSSGSAGRVFLASLNGEETLPSTGAASGRHAVAVPGAASVTLLQSDGASAVVGSASDGRSQPMAGVGSTRVGRPGADPQRLT